MSRKYDKMDILLGLRQCLASDTCSSDCPYSDEYKNIDKVNDCTNELYLDVMQMIDDLLKAADKEEDDKMPDILSCPFCGGKAKLFHSKSTLTHEVAGSYVMCEECESQGKYFDVSSEYSSDEEAIKTWNRRN